MSDSRRAFEYALLASLALHALVLFAFPGWIDSARRAVQFPPPLIARLMEQEPVALQAEPVPAPPIEKPAPPKARAAKPAPPQPHPEPAPVVATAPMAPPASAPQSSAALPAPLSPVAAVQPEPATAGPSAEALAAQTGEQYRMELIAAITRLKDRKRYPPQAFENNWQGDVVLGVSIRANGRVAVAVNRTSQYEVLDQQALQFLGQAVREVPLPPALRGRDLALKDLTVQYRLTRERLVRD